MVNNNWQKLAKNKWELSSRKAVVIDVLEALQQGIASVNKETIKTLEEHDLIYRSLCSVMYNYVPTSGHPGGSISSGRIVNSLLYQTMSYDIKDPDAPDSDLLSYAAGHKALGLYTAWALRNEITRITMPSELPSVGKQLRLEDLLGFRRNPTQETPLFREHDCKPLDGHPTPLVPFVKMSTGASGVGVTSSVGYALGLRDIYRENTPFVHILEGEGGLTPGRVSEAMASASTSQLSNIILHIDWNQSSIDSDKVCREGNKRGDYVQWDPVELAYFHDWNVIIVKDGKDFSQVLAAQELALQISNHLPTAIVYRTVKGWKYGIEGRKSHGAGHKFCSPEFFNSLKEFEDYFKTKFPRLTEEPKAPAHVEKAFYDCLLTIRQVLEARRNELTSHLGHRIKTAKEKLQKLARIPRNDRPKIELLYDKAKFSANNVPAELTLKTGDSQTLRGVLGDVFGYLNRQTNGAIFGSASDLYGSTNLSNINKGFSEGFYSAVDNPNSRQLSIGGICEDAMGGVLAGLAAHGSHIGIGASYGAFVAALQHVTARLHAIGQQYRSQYTGEIKKYNPFVILCAHAGIKTGEDGPTHADPQALQLFQENFPKGSMITLTPWDSMEIWPLVITSLQKRPAIIAPFVTRPNEKITDWKGLRLGQIEDTINGLYAVRRSDSSAKRPDGTIVLQGSEVMVNFIYEALPRLEKDGFNLNVFYVSSAELFDLLPEDKKRLIYPDSIAKEAMGITGFTLSTMYRWIMSDEGRQRTLHPFGKGHYLGSGQAHKVIEEAELDGTNMYKKVVEYIRARK